jgi:hypothetical protein
MFNMLQVFLIFYVLEFERLMHQSLNNTHTKLKLKLQSIAFKRA